MNKKFKLYQSDLFKQAMFQGNPPGVVLNANGLTASQMQQIATELN